MIRLLITILLLSSINLTLICGENENYISEKINNIEKLISKGTFINGIVYLNNDSIESKILTFRGKHKLNNILFCISKNNADSIIIFTPNEITGYRINNTNFISHNSNGNLFFLKQIKDGQVELFEKPSIPSDNRFLYYIKFKNKSDYFVINPLENNVIITNIPDNSKPESSGATKVHFKSKSIHEKFAIFISKYFEDCPKVVNMVKSGFYTMNELPLIIESYNNCKE